MSTDIDKTDIIIDKTIQMSPGTESILRASYAKTMYYHDDINFFKIVEILLPFDKNNQIANELSNYQNTSDQMKYIREDLHNSKIGEIYLPIQKKLTLMSQYRTLEKELHRLRTILTTFITVTMEKKDIMKEEFTMLKLTKLPLTLKGIKGMSEQTDDDEDDDYEDDY